MAYMAMQRGWKGRDVQEGEGEEGMRPRGQRRVHEGQEGGLT